MSAATFLVTCNKCGYSGDISEFPEGRDFFQHPYVAGCPKCDNSDTPGAASMRMFNGVRPFTIVRSGGKFDALPTAEGITGGYGDPCACCGSLLGCYCHEFPHFRMKCPGLYIVPQFDWFYCLKQWGLAFAWRPRGEQGIEFQVLCFVLTFRWRPILAPGLNEVPK